MALASQWRWDSWALFWGGVTRAENWGFFSLLLSSVHSFFEESAVWQDAAVVGFSFMSQYKANSFGYEVFLSPNSPLGWSTSQLLDCVWGIKHPSDSYVNVSCEKKYKKVIFWCFVTWAIDIFLKDSLKVWFSQRISYSWMKTHARWLQNTAIVEAVHVCTKQSNWDMASQLSDVF